MSASDLIVSKPDAAGEREAAAQHRTVFTTPGKVNARAREVDPGIHQAQRPNRSPWAIFGKASIQFRVGVHHEWAARRNRLTKRLAGKEHKAKAPLVTQRVGPFTLRREYDADTV